MPRKKTVQPEPTETFTLDDGTIVEVRDEGVKLIGRGSHKHDTLYELRVRILEWVVNHYLSAKGPKLVKKDFMKSASKLEAEMTLSGLFPEVTDLGAVRKRIYPWVRDHLGVLTKLVEENNKKNTPN
jgi:hypothetical protein